MRSLADLAKPISNMTVSEWAELERHLPTSTVAHGKWDNRRTPYLVEIMNCMSAADPARVVVVMAGAQLGKSEAGYNTIGYWMDQSPAPIILSLPTAWTGGIISRDRIDPLLATTPCLKKKVAAKGSRKSNNTVAIKDFIGGKLLIITAKSAPSLRAIAAKYVIADEVDAYPITVGTDGDPIGLLQKRMITFGDSSKMLITSTPLIKGHSRVENNYNQTDKRRYFVPCKKCGNMATIDWINIIYTVANPSAAQLRCAKCKALHDESDKVALLAGGEWRATAKPKQKGWVGFHISALYSPYGWYSWGQAATDFEKAKKDEAALQVWTNTVLGETYEYYAYRPALTLKNAEQQSYGKGKHAPRDVLVLTAGIDTQADRVEMYVWGWARGEKPRLVDYLMMTGDLTEWAFWHQFYLKYKSLEYITADGRRLKIAASAVDSGGRNTLDVYRYVLRLHGSKPPDRTVIAIKGKEGRREIISHRILRSRVGKQKKEVRVELFTVGVDVIKTQLYQNIEKKILITPFAFANGEMVPPSFYEQLTAEELITPVKNGIARPRWVKIHEGARNEAMDCYNYAYAALKFLDIKWAALEKRENERGGTAGIATPEPTKTAAVATGTPAPKKRRVIVRGGSNNTGPRRRRY